VVSTTPAGNYGHSPQTTRMDLLSQAGKPRFGEEEDDDRPMHVSKRAVGSGSVCVRMCTLDGYRSRARVPRVCTSNHAGNFQGRKASPEVTRGTVQSHNTNDLTGVAVHVQSTAVFDPVPPSPGRAY
jgi:hypothetical protein